VWTAPLGASQKRLNSCLESSDGKTRTQGQIGAGLELKGNSHATDLLIVVLVLAFGGGGGYYGYRRWGTGGGIGIVGLVLIILLVLYLFGGMRM